MGERFTSATPIDAAAHIARAWRYVDQPADQMTFRRIPRAPSKRSIAAHAAFYSGKLEEMPAPAKPRAKPRKLEAIAQRAIRQWLRLTGQLSFRNNVGRYQYAPGKWVTYGLCVGSSDVIVPVSIVVTPDMVGRRIALFGAIEIKAADGVVSDEQQEFIDSINRAGGRAGVARDIDEARKVLGI